MKLKVKSQSYSRIKLVQLFRKTIVHFWLFTRVLSSVVFDWQRDDFLNIEDITSKPQ